MRPGLTASTEFVCIYATLVAANREQVLAELFSQSLYEDQDGQGTPIVRWFCAKHPLSSSQIIEEYSAVKGDEFDDDGFCDEDGMSRRWRP